MRSSRHWRPPGRRSWTATYSRSGTDSPLPRTRPLPRRPGRSGLRVLPWTRRRGALAAAPDSGSLNSPARPRGGCQDVGRSRMPLARLRPGLAVLLLSAPALVTTRPAPAAEPAAGDAVVRAAAALYEGIHVETL